MSGHDGPVPAATISPGALHGVRVIDATQVMAGPFCAMQLCDMGADVIKVEPPAGDSTRRMAGARGTDSPSFNAVNRGKRGIVLDLKTPAGREAFTRLAAQADVVVENYRPGVMDALGLGYAALSAVNPRIIYASISGYGLTGPYRDKGGFDLVAQGVAGIMSVTGEPGRPPVKAGVPLTDLGAGLYAVSAILAALFFRERTGCGQHVDTSLLEAGVALSVWESTEYFATGGTPQPLGSAHRMSAPYQAMQCADGYITVAAANDRLFVRLCTALGHPEWATRDEFRDDTRRVAHREQLAGEIEAVMRTRTRQEWLTLLEAHEIPCGPINTYPRVFEHPQVLARQMVVAVDHPTLGPCRALGSPIKMSVTPPCPTRRAPLLGEHTREVLREAGYDEQAIDRLKTDTRRPARAGDEA